MSQIDVQITFDAESILLKYTPSLKSEAPVLVDAKYIFMVVADDEAVSGNGGANLNIKARTLDTIHWSETTPGVAYSTILYAFPTQTSVISTPTPRRASVTVPLPNPSDPTHPEKQTIKDYYWSSEVLEPTPPEAPLAYHFNFMIVDRDGKTLGYYYWDPFITITT